MKPDIAISIDDAYVVCRDASLTVEVPLELRTVLYALTSRIGRAPGAFTVKVILLASENK